MKASYHRYNSFQKLHTRPFFSEVVANIEESRVIGTTHTVFAKYLPNNAREQDYVLLEMSPTEARLLGKSLISASEDVDEAELTAEEVTQ